MEGILASGHAYSHAHLHLWCRGNTWPRGWGGAWDLGLDQLGGRETGGMGEMGDGLGRTRAVPEAWVGVVGAIHPGGVPQDPGAQSILSYVLWEQFLEVTGTALLIEFVSGWAALPGRAEELVWFWLKVWF